MLKFSIIIPAYNAEKSIEKCLRSLISQPYASFELIVIDDGSTDNTANIVKDIACSDSRIRLFSRANSGVSSARILGLTYASGDIVAFVDSDDYVDPSYFQELSDAFTRTCADVVYFEFNRVTAAEQLISCHHLPEISASENYYAKLVQLSETDMFGYPWMKAFRRNILHTTHFDPTVTMFEDEVFTCNALSRPVQLYFLHKTLYYYICSNAASLARKTHSNYHLMCDKAFHAWTNLLKSTNARHNAFLQKKALHMQFVCKFYGLERITAPLQFYKELSDCSFMQYVSSSDRLLVAIANKRWFFVRKEVYLYRLKLFISHLLKGFRHETEKSN